MRILLERINEITANSRRETINFFESRRRSSAHRYKRTPRRSHTKTRGLARIRRKKVAPDRKATRKAGWTYPWELKYQFAPNAARRVTRSAVPPMTKRTYARAVRNAPLWSCRVMRTSERKTHGDEQRKNARPEY